jgi:ferredoxin, 2Fe-2S
MRISYGMSEAEPEALPRRIQTLLSSARVRVMPLDIEIDVLTNETLMAAARRMALRWPSVCNGQGNCTACYVKIEDGIDNASPVHQQERERLDFAGRRDPSFRLACQLKVSGPMRVSKKGIKLPDL